MYTCLGIKRYLINDFENNVKTEKINGVKYYDSDFYYVIRTINIDIKTSYRINVLNECYKNDTILFIVLEKNDEIYDDLIQKFKEIFNYKTINETFVFINNNDLGKMRRIFRKIVSKYKGESKIINPKNMPKSKHKPKYNPQNIDSNGNVIYTIYKITNIINNKCYYGSTTRKINLRFSEHKKAMYTKDNKLYNAMFKYGIDNFKMEIVKTYDGITETLLRKIETDYIKKYNTIENGYNSNYSYNYNNISYNEEDNDTDYYDTLNDTDIIYFNNVDDDFKNIKTYTTDKGKKGLIL